MTTAFPVKTPAFPVELQLPAPEHSPLADVQDAIRLEYNASIMWKQLTCRRLTAITHSEGGGIFELQTGQAVDFDWTWEGAVAFRPRDLETFLRFPEGFSDPLTDSSDSVVWVGEVVEVEEATGKVFVKIETEEQPPTIGSFFVRPFQFLSVLHSIYRSVEYGAVRRILPARLQAACGGIHPRLEAASGIGLPELQRWWQHGWAILWGPPGTGKTYTVGHQIAEVLRDTSERVLVVSTTNHATDCSAVAIGNASRNCIPDFLSDGLMLRVGKGTSLKRFAAEKLQAMLRGTETDFLNQIERRLQQLAQTPLAAEKALIRGEISDLRKSMRDAGVGRFLDSRVRLIVATAFRATTLTLQPQIVEMFEAGAAPFTTVVIDEAGLISRAAVAVLSLLASRRVVLVGDARQLAPISRICRLLPPEQMKWLSSSGLSHLHSLNSSESGVHVLRRQHRMHPEVCRAVSGYQYEGLLETAESRRNASFKVPPILESQPRAIWYVLDHDASDIKSIRADRGPGNKSWTREATITVLEKLFTDRDLQRAWGLFITPFRAQASEIAGFLTSRRILSWASSTVHSRQGTEADIVIFDTVNAGSYGWPSEEWKRLVNVALSRARECIIFIASRAEMDEPYLRPLKSLLKPQTLKKQGRKLDWAEIHEPESIPLPHTDVIFSDPGCLGAQLYARQQQRPVLSHEQQRLCALKMDGRPRLVRGVAGSGKTVVLAHWMMQTIRRTWHQPEYVIWAVYGNRSLEGLIRECIQSAWEKESGGREFPWQRVYLLHVNDILRQLLSEQRLSLEVNFDYDRVSSRLLQATEVGGIQPRCDALFLDEAQDMGPNTIRLLNELVRPSEAESDGSRAINIFYDNAQNIYRRGTPAWGSLGISMRGRSTIMKESFRSTCPITELALNVLLRLQPPEKNADHAEMLSLGLIETAERDGQPWWNVCFNQIDGPLPELRVRDSRESEFEATATYLENLITKEHVRPDDICLIYNSQNIRRRIENQLMPRLRLIGVDVSLQVNSTFQRSRKTLLATTANSYKGFDAEIVVIPGVDQFTAESAGILANNLYVAMTRARSILTMFTHTNVQGKNREIVHTITACLQRLRSRSVSIAQTLNQAESEDLLTQLGRSRRNWLKEISNRYVVMQEPLLLNSGELPVEPIFWIQTETARWACFGNRQVTARDVSRMHAAGVRLLATGELPTET